MPTLAEILRQTGYSNDGELSAPAPVAPTMTTILQKHIASLPQQLATNQAAMDNTIKSWNKTDFGTGQPNPNYRPEALNEFAQLVPNMLGATAWHGTPHEIKGLFDIGKVGTGEGAQAYGHGMYFAENPAVAKEYQKMLAGPEQTAAEYLKMYKTPAQAISVLEGGITPNLTAEAKKFSQDAIDVLKSGKELKGNLYKVDIPDEHIPYMLDWDKPLSEQSQEVKNALSNIPHRGKDWTFKDTIETLDAAPHLREDVTLNPTGSQIYSLFGDSMMVGNKATGQIEASKKLNEIGIKGIRYLDEGSRDAGKGTSNFVMFDPSTVKILEKNGVPTRKEILEQQLNKVIE